LKASGNNAVVECLPHHPKVKSSNTAVTAGIGEIKSQENLFPKTSGSSRVVECLPHHCKVQVQMQLPLLELGRENDNKNSVQRLVAAAEWWNACLTIQTPWVQFQLPPLPTGQRKWW
jgi:hypothetical protein